MNVKRLLRAGLFGACLAGAASLPALAEVLRIQSSVPTSALTVPMNRAIVVESDQPFTELSIANPGIADISSLSDQAIYVLGKTPGRTTLTILGPNAQLIANVEVHVSPDVAEFRERLRQIMPNERIEVRTANDGIVLSGLVSSAAAVDQALELANRYAPDRVSNLMSVGGTQQVMLKVRFAEMARSVGKSLGSEFSLGIDGGSTIGIIGASNRLGTPSGGIGIAGSSGNLQFSVLLEALESRGLVRTLAEPNLITLSGQEAKFLAGGEYPIPVLNDNGSVTVEYKPFGVELNFTPWVQPDGVINLALNTAVSGIDKSIVVPGPFPYNAFRRRDASTTVELRDGESFAIAGLLQDDFANVVTQVPWIGTIPILGALFRSADYQRDQSELVVVITAHLVTPTRGEALMLPTDRVRLPSEAELFLLGRTEGVAAQRTPAGEIARQGFAGPYGYVMD